MERDDFQKLKTLNDLTPDELIANLEVEIEEYKYEAQGRPDDYVMEDHIMPKYRAAFFQRIVDLIDSLNAKLKKDDIPENAVVISREEYDGLKKEAEHYDPFWFCTFGGCEGVCKECKNTCEMSIFVKERKETAEKYAKRAKEEAFTVFMGEPIIRASKIDEICKEFTEAKND